MILKKLKRTSFKKTKATMIGNLVDYIVANKDADGNAKLLFGGTRNFFSKTRAGWKAEMVSLASESIQSKMPVAHWVMSWQENEQPTREQVSEAVTVFLLRMGLEGHQTIYAMHGNSANLHVHIVVNRTNPETLKVIQPHRGFDIEEAHRIVALLEHRQGWASEANARYTVNDQGEIVRQRRQDVAVPREKAQAFESATGEKSAQRIAQERGHEVIKKAVSWRELHESLAAVGLRFEKKGSGAVVFVGDIAVKASSIDRAFGLTRLEKRLGAFEPGNYTPEMKAPEPEPVSEVALAGWREYQRQEKQRREEREAIAEQQAESARLLKHEQREERRGVLAELARHGLSMLNIARHFLKIQQREAKRRLREDNPAPSKPLPRFSTWLKQKAPHAAALWKYRRRIPAGMNLRSRPVFAPVGKLSEPYAAYREQIMRQTPDPMDESRRDGMIALWMRATGYTQEETAKALGYEGHALRNEKRDWKDYAHRVLRYAFGVAGDIDIASARPTQKELVEFAEKAEELEAVKRKTQIGQQQPTFKMR
jgi:hypothetical protein